MRFFRLNRNAIHNPTMNIDKLWTLVSEETKKKYENNKEKVKIIKNRPQLLMLPKLDSIKS